MSASAHSRRLRWLAGWIGLLLVVLLAAPLDAGALASWTLTDSSGQRFALSLFEQADPGYPVGWRLRLNARSPGQSVDHQRPLLLSDGGDGSWTLPNLSQELVPVGETVLPPTSAQFDAGALEPRPSEVMPLRLEIPIDARDGVAQVMLPPEAVEALHALPLGPMAAVATIGRG